MAGDWKVMSIEDCMASLIDYRGKTPEKTSFGIPLITAKVVKRGRIETPTEFIAVDDYETWMRRGIPKPGDVIITTEAPLGEVAQLGHERIALAQRIIALRGKEGLIDNMFLKFLMQSQEVQDQLRARASGTTVVGIKQSELRKVMLTLPSIEEQHAIAHILGTLDDKIELNRRMNETLEAMARALFKSWFVNFDPVRRNIARHTAPIPPSPVISDEIDALFPDAFEDSALGKIPRGWSIATIGDILELAYGKALKEDNRQAGSIPVYGSNGQIGWHNEVLVKGPGIVVGRKGNPGIITWVSTDFFSIDTTFYVVPTERCSSMYFLFYALIAQNLPAQSADSAVPGLNRNIAYMSKQLVPNAIALDAFDQKIKPFLEQKQQLNAQSRTLAYIRDTILPKLVSGEIRVGDFSFETSVSYQ